MFGSMLGGFNAKKLKPQLKMATGRIQIASNKKSALLKQSMREVAKLLDEDPPKEEKAKIKAEALIRDDHMIEAFEILQLECELLHERIKLLEYTKECPHDLVSVISTLIWASHRVDVPELNLIRKQFTAKYGKTFAENAMKNTNSVLNERVVSKLSIEPPAAYLVQTYLEKICDQFQVDWTPSVKLTSEQMIEPMAAPSGYSVPVAQGTGLGSMAYVETGIESTGIEAPYIPPAVPSAPSKDESTVMPPAPSSSMDLPPEAPPNTFPRRAKSKPSFDEPDIVVPGTPSEDKKNHSDDDDEDGGMNDSYANLAARFSQLKK